MSGLGTGGQDLSSESPVVRPSHEIKVLELNACVVYVLSEAR